MERLQRGRGVVVGVERGHILLHGLAVEGNDLALGGELLVLSSSEVHHLGVACRGVELYVERLTCLLASEEGGGGLKIIVVTAPRHAWPARVAHPDDQAHAVL